MSIRPLLIGPNELTALAALRKVARENPVDNNTLMERLATPEGKQAHRDQMTAQSLLLPFGYMVTFSIEVNHSRGVAARHMSMSVDMEDRYADPAKPSPSPAAVFMIAKLLGFAEPEPGNCHLWAEQLDGHGAAINCVQIIQAEVVTEGKPN